MENGVKFANMNGSASADLESLEKPMTNGHVNGEVNGTGDDLKLVEKSVKENFAPGDRIKRKAKRLTKLLAKDVAIAGQTAMNTPRHLKNFRKPRNGFGRGLPKKGAHYFSLCYKNPFVRLYLSDFESHVGHMACSNVKWQLLL